MRQSQTPTYAMIADNDRFWQITQKILSLLPWLWLSFMALLIAAAIGQTGAWPSYGQPDPKQISGLGILVMPLTLLMMLVLGTLPFGLLFTTFAAWKGRVYQQQKTHRALSARCVFISYRGNRRLGRDYDLADGLGSKLLIFLVMRVGFW
ncbi:MAG: hypothetical protein H6652_20515 [Ardenticatenaceae bacterium]|nr:hypothetical protein [Ardenticatenaceae bacterium]